LKAIHERNCRSADTLTIALTQALPSSAGVPAGSFLGHNRKAEISKVHHLLREDGVNAFEADVIFEVSTGVLLNPYLR
jgi:hypothetical protein